MFTLWIEEWISNHLKTIFINSINIPEDTAGLILEFFRINKRICEYDDFSDTYKETCCGVQREYSKNGVLMNDQVYTDNRGRGTLRQWKNGLVKKEIYYDMAKKINWYKHYNDSGTLVKEVRRENGRVVVKKGF